MLEWEEYKQKFIDKNKRTKRFTDDEVEYTLNYAKNLYDKNVPIIYSVDHLSKLIGVIPNELYKIISSNSKHYYKEYKIDKKTGGFRNIKAPLPILNFLQKWIFQNILQNIKPSVFCKSYQKNLSLKDNAKFHRRQVVLLKLDISNFFDEITREKVFFIFYNLGYNNEVSSMLADLVTYSDGRKRKGIPQGACTSPIISNLVLNNFDEKIGSKCIKKKIRYTRYADDLTFSGDFNPIALKKFISTELLNYGFKINEKKTKVIGKSQRQIVTGVVVNDKMQVSRKYRKNLRLELYYLINNSEEHFKRKQIFCAKDKIQYLVSILGKINFILQINNADSEFKSYKKKVYQLLISLR